MRLNCVVAKGVYNNIFIMNLFLCVGVYTYICMTHVCVLPKVV